MDTTFFYLSKILWFFANPFHLVLLLAICALIALLLKWIRLTKLLLTTTTLIMLVFSIYPIGDFALTPLEKRFSRPEQLPTNIDGIIILGGSIKQQQSAAWGTLEANSSNERITKGAALARAYPNAKVIFTGGSGLVRKTSLNESEIAELMLLEQGVKRQRIILEDKSRNTYQNAVLSKQVLNNNIDGNWILVTSAFHMPRSVAVFRSIGWDTIPFPVDYKSLPPQNRSLNFNYKENMGNFAYALHEWLGLIAYYYTGKSAELFPQ